MRETLLDKAIGYFSPVKGYERQRARQRIELVKNSGYGNYGASVRKNALKGWVNTEGSVDEDVHDNLDALRSRSRDLYMGAPVATAAIKRYRTNVIGSGLSPKPVIDGELLGLTEEATDELEKQISREFALWAESEDCDARRMSSFYEIQQIAFLNWLMSGDVFVLLQSKERSTTPYTTCIQLVEADRVCTPWGKGQEEQTRRIIQGVETDEGGEVVAYHICKRHPLSYRGDERAEWTRVPAYGAETGRRNVLHLLNVERVEARRGVPILAPVLESLKQLGRYTDAEMTAAVVNAYFTVFVEKQEESAEAPPLGQQDLPADAAVDEGNPRTIELGAGTVVDLEPGEHANTAAPGRPNGNFDGFVTAICKQIGAALELPYEVLMQQFTSSYSASRAALMEAWKAFEQWRDWMVEKFCQPAYEEWLSEAVALGRVTAPGFWSDPLRRKAYCNAQWYGPTQGQLDPVKEVKAAEMRIRYGLSNRAKEAMELTGTDFRDNIRTAKRETALMIEAGLWSVPEENTETGEEQA